MPAPKHYTTNGNAITITRYNGPGGAVTIPETITGLPVTWIGVDAFYNCSNLTSITIPQSVTNLDNQVFFGCSQLTAVDLPTNLVNIGTEAFYKSGITNVTIPASVTNIYYDGRMAILSNSASSSNSPAANLFDI
jgi:hypothetical protein